MKLKFLFVFVLLSSAVQAQWSVSGGVFKQRDQFTEMSTGVFIFGRPSLHRYNGMVVQADRVKSDLRMYAEVSYTDASYEYSRTSYTATGGGSSPYRSNRYVYGYSGDFDYLSLKFGMGKEFFRKDREKWWVSSSFNFFGQFSQRLGYGQSEEIINHTYVYESMPGVYNSIRYPEERKSEVVRGNKRFYQFGTEFKARLGFKSFFMELRSSWSIADRVRLSQRSTSSTSLRETPGWYFNSGLSLGYVFPGKKLE